MKNASISANAEVQTPNTESGKETEFKHPKLMGRISRIISRVVTDIDVSKESQLRVDTEDDRMRKARKKNKKELLSIQRSIQDKENLQNFQSGYAIGGIQSKVNPKTIYSEKMETNQTSEAEKSKEH
ncbi:hypothetical protein JTB14_031632 [Gonioctena quinquepunctata]|nr:hypothetical protein JTB14_031632 [Gonioctena quinquepunctata]